MNPIARLTCCVALAGVAWSQVSNPAFEVATIKRSDPTADVGQMIRDPRIVALAHVSLQNLLAQAYRIKNFQISGASWLDSERFDIVATLPDGATRDQLPAMLQTLLRERFKLAFHLEQKTLEAYVLFARKGATKLTATDGEIRDVRTSVGAVRRRLSGKVSMPYFAGLLSNMLDRPVSDMTELGGLYDVDLEWSADEAIGANFDDPPSLFTVLQENLGLRLDRRKTPVELYVIDHVERLPTEN
jgi:uncharacterized protein (TIGR03435 family)